MMRAGAIGKQPQLLLLDAILHNEVDPGELTVGKKTAVEVIVEMIIEAEADPCTGRIEPAPLSG